MNSALPTNKAALPLLLALTLAACADPGDDSRCQIERRADPARVVRVQGDCSQQDFSGVDLSDADLSGVTWGDTATCPDGTRSADHGGTCQGHLDPDLAADLDLPEDSPDEVETDTAEDLQSIDIVDDLSIDQEEPWDLPPADLALDAPPDLPMEEPGDGEDEEATCDTNACGGCGALAGEPGALCGPCNTGTWRCDDNGVVCQDLPACASRACVSLLDCPDTRDLCIDNICTPAGTVLVPAGAYLRGSPENEPGRSFDEAQQTITLSRPVFVHIYEYTHRLWDVDSGEAPHFERLGCLGEDCPVTNLSWYQALGVANVASMTWGLEPCYYDTSGSPLPLPDPLDSSVVVRWPEGYDCEGWRLPTDAEWEHFARAGTTTAWSFGDNPNALDAFAWLNEDGGAPHPVGEKRPNPWGLYDIHGNVVEYVWDSYLAIPEGADVDPLSPPPGGRYMTIIARGGNHTSHHEEARSAARQQYSPYINFNANQSRPRVGLRLVRTVTPQP